MAKFCIKCGTENTDDSFICTTCGASLDEPIVEATTSTTEPSSEETATDDSMAKLLEKVDEILAKLHLDRTKALLIGGAVVGVLLLVLLINLIFPGPEAVARKFLDGFGRGDAQAVVDCMPSYMWNDDEDDKEDIIDSLDDTFDALDFRNFSYEIKKVRELDEDDIDAYEDQFDEMEKYYDEFDPDDVSDFKEINAKIKLRIDGETEEDNIFIILCKYKGQWKVLEFESDLIG